ncbi:Hypothetical protein FKW44_019086 [Caligus rogercresseyi]|uniref:Uncharacterized protein n=1 Tax=Caligus rogercresseyi TaxID=217165 RepID=A0A7T8JX66_CALRO|nr:Hypothetical protein FKW44_019086 [Caligus rogercresseyi]
MIPFIAVSSHHNSLSFSFQDILFSLAGTALYLATGSLAIEAYESKTERTATHTGHGLRLHVHHYRDHILYSPRTPLHEATKQ